MHPLGSGGFYLVIFVLQLGLRALATAPYSLGIVPVESTAGLGMVQARAVLVVTGDQQRHAKGTAHLGLAAVGALAEAQGQVADGLRAALDAEGLGVVEGVRLALDAGVLDHAASIGLQPGHGAADVPVDLDDLLDGRGLEEGGGDALLDAEDDALRGSDADSRAAELDGFERVLDLEETSFGGEGAGLHSLVGGV